MSSDKDKGTKFSSYHPIIPKIYTPAWKLDMKNRDRIIENCKEANIPYQEIEATLYLEKRERLYKEGCKYKSSTKDFERLREKQLKQPLHSPLSKYQSTLMFRNE